MTGTLGLLEVRYNDSALLCRLEGSRLGEVIDGSVILGSVELPVPSGNRSEVASGWMPPSHFWASPPAAIQRSGMLHVLHVTPDMRNLEHNELGHCGRLPLTATAVVVNYDECSTSYY